MEKKELENYLANIVLIMKADGEYDPHEIDGFQTICKGVGATEDNLEKAMQVVENGDYGLTPAGRLSDKIRNLEDMIYVFLSTSKLPDSEKKIVLSYAKMIQLTQQQINEILKETRQRFESENQASFCDACGKQMPQGSKYCPFCGGRC